MTNSDKLKLSTLEDHSSYKDSPRIALWIFKTEKKYDFPTGLKGCELHSRWLKIYPDGRLCIPKDYSWDGCTFKWSILDLFIFGIPDGIVNIETMKPKTYFASLVHDSLYQYYPYHPFRRKELDVLFLNMMKDANFKLAFIYYLAVRAFGWVFTYKRPKIDLSEVEWVVKD